MAPLRIGAPVSTLAGIGPRRTAALAEQGVRTLTDLLWQLPRSYQDRRTTQQIATLREGLVTVSGTLTHLRLRRPNRRLCLLEGRLEDPTGDLRVVWFNQPFLRDKLRLGDRYRLTGRFRQTRFGGQLNNAELESTQPGTAGIVPVYSALGRLHPRRLREWVAAALDALDLAAELPEHLPADLLLRRGLPSRAAALRELHSPSSSSDAVALSEWRSPAHARLIYGELLEQQLWLALSRARLRRCHKPQRYSVDDRLRQAVRAMLPFRLTGAQRRAVGELVEDLAGPVPMRRLLQGDVGSGKTIVAACGLLAVLESGWQAAYLAPTELLAEQQFETLQTLLGDRHLVGLVTGSQRGTGAVEALASGEVRLAVGTHALLEAAVRFDRLGFLVIDEQHRFGVEQRAALEAKGPAPDVLVMSATPIPRSLALSAYGDLDVTVLDELPRGRQPVVTELCTPRERHRVYERLADCLRGGGRGFVVFPRIEQQEDEVATLAGLGSQLLARFAPYGAAQLHGRLDAEERRSVLQRFRDEEVRLLLATSIIEVGVDVPGASAMVIESADRLGLAQLHQLRGRVGRGLDGGWCVAIAEVGSPEAKRRLEAFASCDDGFELAEEDLRIRGPGELLGVQQTGAPGYRIADLTRDSDWLEKAHRDAGELVARLGDGEREKLEQRLAGRSQGHTGPMSRLLGRAEQ